MTIETTLIPVWASDGLPYTETNLKIQVDVSSILSILKFYDIYIVVSLTVPDSNITTESLTYEYTRIFRNVTTKFIDFKVSILGTITNSSSLTANAKAYYIAKNGGNF